jgi:hypothetical protein
VLRQLSLAQDIIKIGRDPKSHLQVDDDHKPRNYVVTFTQPRTNPNRSFKIVYSIIARKTR